MPVISTTTNVKISHEKEIELKTELGKAIAVLPGKSERWLMCEFYDDTHMYFAGSGDEPIAFIDVGIFGDAQGQPFDKMTEVLTEIYGRVLGVAPDKMYVRYNAGRYWGWNGSNF